MKMSLRFHDKPVAVTLSETAVKRSRELAAPMLLEVQIYFSCVLVKRVAIYSDTPQEGAWQLEQGHFASLLQSAQPVSGKLFVRFNTVMTQTCPVADHPGPPPVSDFEIVRPHAFVPQWMTIEYRDGKWLGDYGWHNTPKGGGISSVQIRGGC